MQCGSRCGFRAPVNNESPDPRHPLQQKEPPDIRPLGLHSYRSHGTASLFVGSGRIIAQSNRRRLAELRLASGRQLPSTEIP
jgi:hypothetical protein